MRYLLRGVVLKKPEVFFGKSVDAAVCSAIDDAYVHSYQFGVDANDVVL
jgi:hypothetical protein